MKAFHIFTAIVLLGLSNYSSAQVIAPEKSARAAAISDTRFINSSIEDNRDAMYVCKQAINRAADERVREQAQQMFEDHTSMLYSMEQLQTAGGGSKTNTEKNEDSQTKELIEKIINTPGAAFDSVWVSNVLQTQQALYDKFIIEKEIATNSQLKTAVSEAIPILRKHVSQLKTLKSHLLKIAIQARKLEAAENKNRSHVKGGK